MGKGQERTLYKKGTHPECQTSIFNYHLKFLPEQGPWAGSVSGACNS